MNCTELNVFATCEKDRRFDRPLCGNGPKLLRLNSHSLWAHCDPSSDSWDLLTTVLVNHVFCNSTLIWTIYIYPKKLEMVNNEEKKNQSRSKLHKIARKFVEIYFSFPPPLSIKKLGDGIKFVTKMNKIKVVPNCLKWW